MPTWTDNLAAPSWWISVVLVGIAINLLSAYAKPWLDNRFAKVFHWWSVRSSASAAERARTLEALRGNAHNQLLISMDDLRCRLHSIDMQMTAVFFFVLFLFLSSVPDSYILRVLTLLFTAFSWFVSFLMYMQAASLRSLLKEATSKEVHLTARPPTTHPSA